MTETDPPNCDTCGKPKQTGLYIDPRACTCNLVTVGYGYRAPDAPVPTNPPKGGSSGFRPPAKTGLYVDGFDDVDPPASSPGWLAIAVMVIGALIFGSACFVAGFLFGIRYGIFLAATLT